jgi:uncharacterized cysteine cluster protein YcgN (CxxCxxCC family)
MTGANPWEQLCDRCGHEMRHHELDYGTDGPEIDCAEDGCLCHEFQPGRWDQYPLRAQSE